jgi:hypothetical protein
MKNIVSLPAYNNVMINVIDRATGKIVQSHIGHNECTNSMLIGVAHYLCGDGVLNQAYDNSVLSAYVPKYISLGTMGLLSQEADANGYPKYIGDTNNGEHITIDNYPTDKATLGKLYDDYASKRPGFGADGYDGVLNNGRQYFGLGRVYTTIDNSIDCELIAPNFPRAKITHREIVFADKSEQVKTVDLVFSAMVSVGSLAQFRGDNDYVFITECGLWSDTPQWTLNTVDIEGHKKSYYSIPDFWSSDTTIHSNGLLAGYRMVPTSTSSRYFTKQSVKQAGIVNPYDTQDPTLETLKTIEQIDAEATEIANANIDELKQSILRVGPNQVVQIVWKIQLGDVTQFVNKASVVDEEYVQKRIAEALNVDENDVIIQGV